ncbi:fimbria/pilus periplasmic chaperone [Enterobacter cloacae]|uniref:fimbria/pilus periplasmic chaperone n=1 Tax=Enterobacter cloacae TaxID=550 RepID=UPI0034A50F22
MKYHVITKAIIFVGLFCSYGSYAAGIKADTSLLFIDVEKGEGVVNFHNTEARPVMLLTRFEPHSAGQDKLITIVPPLVRIEAHQSQKVRFVLIGNRGSYEPCLLQVYFAGLPLTPAGVGKMDATERQPLRIIINSTEVTPVAKPCTSPR